MKPHRQGGFLIAKVHQLAGRIFAKKLKDYALDEINPAQGRILFVLWQRDGISISDLAQATSLGKSTLTSMLDRLEARGYVRRAPAPGDRRQILIHLTEKNRRPRDVYELVSAEMLELFYRGLTSEEIDAFENTLHKIFGNLRDSTGAPG